MADIFSGWNAVQNARPMAPPSSLPQIATLGNLVDVLEQRRAAREKQAMEEQRYALAVKKQDAINAYHTRRLDQKDAMDRAKHLQRQYDEATKLAGKGQHPGSRVLFDAQGNPVRVDPRYEPAQAPAQVPGQAPAAPPAALPQAPPVDNPLVVPASLESTNVVAQALDRNPDADSADELGMGPQLSPEESQAIEAKRQGMLVPWPEGRPLDLDDDVPEEIGLPSDSPEAQDIEARRSLLLQGDPGGNIDLENPPPPVDYQEPQEGDLPPAGLMSPEESKSRLDELGAPPLPPKGEQPSFQALQEALDSRGSNVPQAEAAQPAAEFKRGKWVYNIRGGQPFEIDLEQARAAHQEEIKSRIAQIDRVLTNPTYANSPMLPRLEQERMMLEAEIGGNAASQLRGQIGKEGLQSQKDAAAMDRAKVGIEGRESLEKLRQEGKMALQNAKRKRGGGGGLGMGTMGVGGGEYINIPRRGGPRPDLLLGRVTQDWRSFSLDEKLPVQLLGLRRLKLADHNMQANGPHSGVLNIEAAFNYLGFIRGGVPVKNETDEMLKERRTWADRIHGVLARAGLGELAAKFMKGDELTKDEAAAAVNVMSPAEKARIAEGIRESLAVMQGQVNDTLKPFVMQYATFDGPGGKLMRQQAIGIVNSRLQTAGLPADFNPFNDTIIPNTSKHMKAGAVEDQAPASAPAAPTQSSSPPAGGGKKLSFDEALQKLLEMKQKAKGGQ
jgi:phosphoribosylformylglycinamidine (FGAM) synthase PurS component